MRGKDNFGDLHYKTCFGGWNSLSLYVGILSFWGECACLLCSLTSITNQRTSNSCRSLFVQGKSANKTANE